MSELEQTQAPKPPEVSPSPSTRTPEAVVIDDFRPARRGLRSQPGSPRERPLISIIILSLDGRDLLDRLFASFEAVNSYPNFEFLVVDHGSSDETIQLLREWRQRLPIKILARGANFSFSESNNKAVRLAAGSLLLLLNNDVVFATDFLTGMAGAIADPSVGAVGLKQYQGLPNSPEPRRIYHLGVRFGWNIVERRLRPHHVRPSALDASIMQSVAAFPAVTASVLLCRRAEYLAVGGFSEAYVYGLEDVDFCCKIRSHLGKEVLCYNEAFVFHPKNATRNREPARRRPLEKQNRRMLQTRWGYRIRRDFIADRFGDDGSFTGRPFTVGIAADSLRDGSVAEFHSPVALGESLREAFGWKVVYLGSDAWAQAGDLDVYISFTPQAGGGLSDGDPHLVKIGCVLDAAEPWVQQAELNEFDLYLCAREDVRAQIAEHFGEVRSLLGQDLGNERQIHDWLARAFAAMRVALKVASSDQMARARLLRDALVREGRLVRIDEMTDWYSPTSLAADIVVAFDPAYRPATDQINLLLSAEGEAAGSGWDNIPPDRPKSRKRKAVPKNNNFAGQIKMISKAIDKLHEARLQGPHDPSLADPRSQPNR